MENGFQEFPKMARLSRHCVVTEKIDGTNAQIFIAPDGDQILVGSRTRWITPEDDNHGFARWCKANENDIRKLGPGRHFGEWWGKGIQRGYGVADKRLSMFNVSRFVLDGQTPQDKQIILPPCIGIVPVLWEGLFDTEMVRRNLERLEQYGSSAAPGFMSPEGVVVFHAAANACFKKTIKNDSEPKSKYGEKNG